MEHVKGPVGHVQGEWGWCVHACSEGEDDVSGCDRPLPDATGISSFQQSSHREESPVEPSLPLF